MDNRSINFQQDMDRVRATYDAVATRYADVMVNELDERPIERGLLDEVVRASRGSGGRGTIADVGCGPGHVTRYLAHRGAEVLGIDLSPAMIDVARVRFPGLDFRVGSMLSDRRKGHFVERRRRALLDDPFCTRRAPHRLSRARTGPSPDSPLLVSFHVSSVDHPMGSSVHLETWFDMPVDLTGYFFDPDVVLADMRGAGFELRARLDREPLSANEYPSRRCYLLLRRA